MIIISLGSNVSGAWGNSDATILQAFKELESVGISVLRRSRLYRTKPYGMQNQPDYINGAAAIFTSRTPLALLSLLKRIETKAGRRSRVRWGPRPLDLDIIDYHKRILNWAKPDRQALQSDMLDLILPHPGIENRPFVLQPILDIAPHWHHPVYGWTASQLLKRLRFAEMGRVLEPVTV